MKVRFLLLTLGIFSFASHGQKITGHITSNNGVAIADAKVKVGSSSIVSTNSDGYFEIEVLKAGAYELHFSAPKYSHTTKQVTVGKDDLSLSLTLTNTVVEVIDIHATPLHTSTIESAIPVNVLAGDALKLKNSTNLGDTLKNEVGIHATYFGPAASSPIIRGLGGPRVLVAQNGLDAGDASRMGPDHVNSTETSTAEQIEVLRGPATLFYGSGAIGGVVNVVDNRVPTYTDTEIDYSAQFNSVANETESAINVNTGTDNIAIHLDGFWRESDNYKIPGHAEIGHHEEDEHEEGEHDEHEENYKELANSDATATGGTVGASYILDNGYVGMSYGYIEREYGITGHVHDAEHDEHEEHDETEENEAHVRGDLTQDRYQLISEYNFKKSFINKVLAKVSYTDYQHQEKVLDEVETEFTNQSVEARADFYHDKFFDWKGAWSLHYKRSDFTATGEEAFTPDSQTEMIALAWLEERHLGDFLIQLGARAENLTIKTDDYTEKDFSPISASLGTVWDYQQGYNIGASLSYSQRAPSAPELYSNGVHAGTSSYEVGTLYDVAPHGDEIEIEFVDRESDLETSYNLDITWRKFEGDFGAIVSVFYNQVDNYYYQSNTGLFMEDSHHDEAHHDEEHHEEEHHEEEHHDEAHHDEESHAEEGLPIYQYQQADAVLYGAEAQLFYQVSTPLKITLFGDTLTAKLVDGGYLPRMPPMRIGTEIDYETQNYFAQLSFSHYFSQENTAELETPTAGYNMLDASFNYYLDGIGNDFVIFVKAENLTNEEARVHSSFLKDSVPLPGRGFSLGFRGTL